MAKFASRCGNSWRFRLRFKEIASDCGCDAMVHLGLRRIGDFGGDGGGYIFLFGAEMSTKKRWFKENAPFILFFLMGPVARTLFSQTLLSEKD